MSAGTAQKLDLPAIIDLDAMDDVREWLVAAAGHGDVRLNASMVERCATNAMMMLITAARTAETNGYSLTIGQPSAALTDAVTRLGLQSAFAELIEGN